MHEPEPPAWAREWIRSIRKEQPMMTSDEKAKVALDLAEVIVKFLNLPQITTNQEAFEILGIASMCYHTLVFKAHQSTKEEKP